MTKKRRLGPKKEGTVCFLVQGNKVLLAYKKRGHGEGKWNGIGGKLLDGEKLTDAVVREIKEEIGVTATAFEKVGELDYGDAFFVHIFLVTRWKGEPIESEEMRPRWFLKTKIPYKNMWDKDKVWLNPILAGKRLIVNFELAGEMGAISKYTIRPYNAK